jgi:ABC-type glycerol-3-phosphate transport system substrate-binding protein
MPQMPGTSNYGGWASTMGLFISENTQEPQVCWDFIKYVSEQPKSLPGIPARSSVNQSAAWEAQVGVEFAEVYRTALSRIKPRSEQVTSNYNPISWPLYTWRSDAIQKVLNGEQPRGQLEAAQQKAEDYLACMANVDISALSEEMQQQEIIACAKQADPNGPW